MLNRCPFSIWSILVKLCFAPLVLLSLACGVKGPPLPPIPASPQQSDRGNKVVPEPKVQASPLPGKKKPPGTESDPGE